jgi:16S rRNA (uracil1498-N3)-methyltransferase
MAIGQMIDLPGLLGQLAGPAWFLSTAPGALPLAAAIENLGGAAELTLLIGPEGGWTAEETAAFEKAGLTGVSLGATILRVETAAVAAGAIIAALVVPMRAARGVA